METLSINGMETTESLVQDMKHASTSVLLKTAKDIVAGKVADSKALDFAAEERIPRVDLEELKVGRVIGRGGFCVVHELTGVRDGVNLHLEDPSSRPRRGRSPFRGSRKDKSEETATARGSSSTGSNTSGHGRTASDAGSRASSDWRKKAKGKFVVKKVAVEKHDRLTFLKATVDLAMETSFLASLHHDNVISLHGVHSEGPFSKGYFLILERMSETLTKRIKSWMDTERQCKGITGLFAGSKRRLAAARVEKILRSYEIAKAIGYMHGKRLIFRDLKPDNVGFNHDDVLKIFDFGVAKELRDDEKVKGGLYKMTGFTGAVRYMAPEVGLSEPYNLKADVYSWALVMWYMMALEPPFGMYSERMIKQNVFKRGDRPKMFANWSERVVELMREAWSPSPHDRPSMKTVEKGMREELALMDPAYAL